jgi:hypothetical protein
MSSRTALARIGDYVFDDSLGRHGLIISEDHSWVDPESGHPCVWDFELLYDDGNTGYADDAELSIVAAVGKGHS